jgi:hypothetical protein
MNLQVEQFINCTFNASGLLCDDLTRWGNLCDNHASELLGVRVARSLIRDANLGLFTIWPRKRGEWICPYLGDIVTNAEYARAPNNYSVQISQGRVISALHTTDGFARFANDAKSNTRNNCLLVTEAKWGREWSQPRFKGSGSKVGVVARCVIQAEAELYVDYGSMFWS